MKLCITFFRSLLLVSYLLLLFVFPSRAQTQASPTVVHETKHDVSPPVRDLALLRPPVSLSAVLPEDSDEVLQSSNTRPQGPDKVVQRQKLATLLPTTTILNFDGLVASTGYPVSDSNGAAGATQFVEATNNQYVVYDKATGTLLLGPAALSNIWAGFGGLCETGGTPFDPIVLYDKAAGRWFVSQFVEDSTLTNFIECIAVSTSSDATGSYARYGFSSGSTLNDYPKFGIWSDAYYGSSNTFTNGVTFTGAQVCAYDRTAMLAGQAAQAICFQKSKTSYLLPSDLDGVTPPPAGSPNYFVKLASPLPSTSLKLYQFHVDFTTPTNSRFTGPLTIPISSWVRLCPTSIVCIPEPSPGEKVNGLGDRLMYRLAYRNFGDHEALVVNHTVDAGGGVAGIRWYEIRSPLASPFVFQQGTYSIANTYLWTGTIGMDKNGDIALGMNASSITLNPSAMVTGRLPTDPLGTMEDIQNVITGTGVQKRNSHRWGDYSSIAVDPVDDCTFWYTSQYYGISGSGTWKTRIAAFKFTGCS